MPAAPQASRAIRRRPLSSRTGARAATVVCLVAVAAVAAGASGDPLPVAAAEDTSAYVAVVPTRLADTRIVPCDCVETAPGTISVDVSGRPGMPGGIVAAAVTITATPAAPGYITVYPDLTARPLVSTLNTRPDRAVANSTIVEVGSNGRLAVFRLVPGDVIVDITGVFVAATTARAGRFVTVPTDRLVDTRENGAGPLPADGELTVPLPAGVPSDATALALNVTSVDARAPGHLAGRPAGTPPTSTSFANVNGSGVAVAASTILPASPSGVTISSFSGGHVVVDVLGYFTGPSAAASADGLFAPLGPVRLLDTREQKPRVYEGGTREHVVSYPEAASLVTNVTVTSADRGGYVTAYPAGTPLPPTSTINPSRFNETLANLAITQVSDRGLAYFALNPTDLVIDVTGMFTGSPVAAPLPPPPNVPTRSRVLIVGDSTLATLNLFTATRSAFIGFDAIVDADNCRRLYRPSCRSPVTGRIPNTIFEAILEAPRPIDVVVIQGGYNDWFHDFPHDFDAIVNASRAIGAHTVIWHTYAYAQVVKPVNRQAYIENNTDLYQLVTLPQYRDVLVGDWAAYTATASPTWTWDGNHMTEYGTWVFTDYVARWIAALEHRPCPKPWGVGGPEFDPCPAPEWIGAVPNPPALY